MNELIQNNSKQTNKDIKIGKIIETIKKYDLYKEISYTIRVSCASNESDETTFKRIKHALSIMSDSEISSAYYNFKQYMEMYLIQLQKLNYDNKLSDTGKNHLGILESDINFI